MRFRTLILAAAIIGGFVYYTTRPSSPLRRGESPGPLWSGPEVTRSAGLGSDESNNIDIYKMASPSVAYITSTVYRQTFFYGLQAAKDLGSGFIINPNGEILTNFHVISGSQQVEVTLPDQTKYKATILMRDRVNDLALIKIEPKKKLTYLNLGDSDRLQVGQKVLAIGNPFGFDGTLTTGVISSLNRPIEAENNHKMEGMIQTDASINSGNSGGPLLDSQGNVIGINTAIYGPNGGSVGIGFALPINRAKTMLDDFKAGRKPARLGISTYYIAGDVAQALELPTTGGLLIQEVAPRSSADAAGLHGARRLVVIGNQEVGIGGDFITAVDGKKVTEMDAVTRALGKKHSGDTLDLTIFRAGHSLEVKVKLGEASEDVL
ncbi:MAG TPA: trypsin-like peptidase domain-containing protein [Bryobacteraceae bacterium]|jgi:S1-C subfamily serine protease|nr:trypsin-like peptidase domain-containing protein [Bryobacteraceae bacterium]